MGRRQATGGLGVVFAGVCALWALTAPAALAAAVRSGRLWAEPIDAQVAALSALAAWACAGWLAVGAVAVVLARAPGAAGRLAGVVAGRITPTLVRRTVEAAVGAAIATSSAAGVGAPAVAAPVSAPATAAVSDTAQARVPGGLGDRVVTGHAVPGRPHAFDRPAAPAPPDRRPAHRVDKPPDDEVVVLRGDTLWSIAAERIGPGADGAAIAAEWPRWYAANRHRIGADPDLIRPGQRLVPPPRR